LIFISEMIAACWMDKVPVYFLSSAQGLKICEVTRRMENEEDGSFKKKVNPEIASEYNKYKDAVDQYDKHCLRDLRSLEKSQVSRKWWHKLYWGLFDGALVNTIILWEMCHGKVNKGRFLRQLMDEMILLSKQT
jgi:adenosine deaminase